MCEFCHMNPCSAGCPNAPDPEPVAKCSRCDGDIMPGDEYAVIGDDVYCYGCIDDMPYCELIPLLGGEWEKAEVES